MIQIVFSPTGGTAKAARLLSQALQAESSVLDLTRTDFAPVRLQPDDLALIALPSYGGRVPQLAAERLQKISGSGARCILMCVYGNRAYEDTLVEMQDLAACCGFTVVAAVAAVAEHSIAHQIAARRPDAEDAALLEAFAGPIRQKLDAGETASPAIPGNRPYKQSGGGKMVPKANKNCVHCGLCARKCPAGAIDPQKLQTADQEACISCMRCVVNCPKGARKINPVILAGIGMMLQKVCADRKSCELFL
jgi:NAD-dependent dihydropyrimidine dehydrogenase PreA subunit